MKKKMYYNMRIKTVHRNLSQVIAKMDTFQQHMLNFPHERLRALVSAMKEVSIILAFPEGKSFFLLIFFFQVTLFLFIIKII